MPQAKPAPVQQAPSKPIEAKHTVKSPSVERVVTNIKPSMNNQRRTSLPKKPPRKQSPNTLATRDVDIDT